VSKCFFYLLLLFTAGTWAGPPVFMADLNGSYRSVEYHSRVPEAVAAIIALKPEAVVIAGDMIAGQVSPPLTEAEIAAMWKGFDTTIYQPLAQKGIQVLAVPGNHDASVYPEFSRERRVYAQFWRERPPALTLSPGSRYPWYYGVALGEVDFVGLDVTAPGDLSAEQELFLAQRRESARTRGRPLLVASHLPLYPVAVGRQQEVFSSSLTPEPDELWVAGHHHAYYAGITPGGGIQLSLPPLGGNRRTWLGSENKTPFGFASTGRDGLPLLFASPGYEPTEFQPGPPVIGDLRRVDRRLH
jgi:hypothetical protein